MVGCTGTMKASAGRERKKKAGGEECVAAEEQEGTHDNERYDNCYFARSS